MASGGAGTYTIRVVMLGKTGAGKSSLGNNLTRACLRKFKVGRGLKSETKYCDWSYGTWDNLTIEVTDTPGLCDTHLPAEVTCKEVGKSVAVATPGPHVIFFVARCDRTFTWEELKAYEAIQEMFPQMNRYMIIVFTGLDVYDDLPTLDEKRQELAQQVGSFGGGIAKMLQAANNRYFGIMNKASQEQVDIQIRDLIKMMTDLVKENGNGYYSTAITAEIGNAVGKLTEDYLKKALVPADQADKKVKEDIVEEKVDPGFLASLGRMIKNAAKKLKDMCPVM